MAIRQIQNDQEHQSALAEISKLMSSQSGTSEGERLSELADVIEEYEARRYPIVTPSGLEAIQFRMEATGLTREDLVPSLGSIEQVDRVLSGAEEITEQIANKLHSFLCIPLEILRSQSVSS